MKERFEILIADRNPNVRRFIAREMTAAGYRVKEAESGADILRQIYRSEAVDLLILDPDLPDVDTEVVLRRVRNRIPFLPVVIHAFASDREGHPSYSETGDFVVKRGASIERLKEVVRSRLGPGPAVNVGGGHAIDSERT